MFVSEYFGLDDELDKMGVFGCVLDCCSSINKTIFILSYKDFLYYILELLFEIWCIDRKFP